MAPEVGFLHLQPKWLAAEPAMRGAAKPPTLLEAVQKLHCTDQGLRQPPRNDDRNPPGSLSLPSIYLGVATHLG